MVAPEPVYGNPSDPNEGRTKSVKGPLILTLVALFVFAGLGALTYKLFFEQQEQAAQQGMACTYEGISYPHGSAFPANDNCNSCSCDNGEVVCTEIACLSPTPSGIPDGSPTPSLNTAVGAYRISVYACNKNNPAAEWSFLIDGELATSTSSPDTTNSSGDNCRLRTFRTDKSSFTLTVTRTENGVAVTKTKTVTSTTKPYIYSYYESDDINILDYDRELELED
jgi:hypothetical protein